MKKVCECGKEFTVYNTIQKKCPWCTIKDQYQKVPKKVKPVVKKNLTTKPRVKSDNSKWKDKAWTLFSQYIRYRDCLSETRTFEIGKCYTCGKELPFKGLQAGHCISGRGNFILLDEDCVKAQCVRCNIELKGNYDVFIPKIIHEHSLEWFEEKKRLSKIPIKKNWHEEYERIKTKCEELTCSKDLPF